MCGIGPSASSRAEMDKREAEYRAEDDFRSLEAAHKITSDKKRHAAAKAHGHKKLAAIKSVVGRK